MTQQVARVNLTGSKYAFKPDEISAAPFLPQFQKAEEELDVNDATAFFMQNVLPVTRGFASVHFTRVVTQHTYPYYLDKLFTLREQASTALFSPAKGQNFIWAASAGAWQTFPFVAATDATVTVAHLKGITYICYAGVGLYQYDFGANTFNQLVITGGPPTSDILGVVSCGLYLLLYTKEQIFYSSQVAPLLFTPALGGPGSTAILANRSEIVVVLSTPDGVIVYTTVNAIFGALTSNVNIPFNFKEIPGSAGVESDEHVAYDGTNGFHIAWTTSGFMQVSPNNADLVWGDLSDAISQGVYYPSADADFPARKTVDKLAVKVTSIGSRYIAISLKDAAQPLSSFQYAHVFDVGLKRWGRIDIPHVDLFEYRAPEFVRALTIDELALSIDSYTQSIDDLKVALTTKTAQFGTTFGVIGNLGAVHIALNADVANLATLESDSSGAAKPKIFLGKYKLVRPRGLCMHSVQLAGNSPAGAVTVRMHAFDGASRRIGSSVMVAGSPVALNYVGRIIGAALGFSVEGAFTLNSAEFTFTLVGGTMSPMAHSGTYADGRDYVTVDSIVVTADGEPVWV